MFFRKVTEFVLKEFFVGLTNGTNGIIAAGLAVSAANPASTAAVQPSLQQSNGSTALTLTSAVELARFMPVMAIEQALDRRKAIVRATQELMQEDVDFGKLPGGERSCLLQPGADKLCNLFGLVIQYEVVKAVEDWGGDRHGGVPFFFYEVKGRAYRGDYLMGEGVGSCNSWESKYKYRTMERTCPNCGKANIRKSKNSGEGWYCWAKTEGCGATFRVGDKSIEGQEVGKKINPDMADSVNTILKMAYKRSKVSTTINATSASEFFTQDVEDQMERQAEDPDPRGHTIDTGDAPYGTRQAQHNVAVQKLADRPKPKPPVPELTSSKTGEIKAAFAVLRERLGETRYFEELKLAGVPDPLQLRSVAQVRELYRRLAAIASEVA